jgi:hypothetical protein
MATNTVLNTQPQLVKDALVEAHYFTQGQNSRYIVGGVIKDFEFDTGKVLIDHSAVLISYNIRRGTFDVAINVHNNLLGSSEFPMIFLNEISPDRRELRFEHVAVDDMAAHDGMLESFVNSIASNPVLNFGSNRLFKIINKAIFDGDLIIRLLEPLPDDIVEESTAWIVDEVSDSFDDTVTLTFTESSIDETLELRGPNFEVETTYGTVTETDFESWNTLLDANTSTSQNIIDTMFSGSLAGTQLKIDYSGFNNFIQFSSAAERIANFKYKLELIEYYDSRIGILNNASGSDATALQNNVAVNTRKKDNIIGSFDGFERWLYNENTASLFTDQTVYTVNDYEVEGGRIGSQPYRITPWPKYISNGKFVLHHTTASLASSYYNAVYATASLYDTENESALIKTIPEHIRLDSNNSQYELFVNMIAHHYDIIYSYIDNLSKVYHPQEHPKLGQSKNTLYQIAKSLGWSLTEGKQASALWQYKLGVNSGSGAYQSTGTLFSKSDEAITAEVWQRIVNNLPYLLKTKGTARSIKALMNTYGIPQTLLSIREYGGPKVSGNVPTLIEDRFTYALHFDDGAHLKIPNNWVSSSIGEWGIDRGEIPVLTHEVRIRPGIKDHMGVMMSRDNDDTVSWAVAIQHTASYSGSDKYGRLHFAIGGDTGKASASMTEYIPIFDGNFWNLSIGVNTVNNTGSLNTTYTLRCQQASDYISDKIVHSTNLQLSPTIKNHYNKWSSQDDGINTSHILRLGGAIQGFDDYSVMAALSASFAAPIVSASILGGNPITNNEGVSGQFTNHSFSDTGSFSGSMQEYRGWLEEIDQATFNIHTTNPTSYVSALNPSASYDTLIRHYTFGTDLKTFDCSGGPNNFQFTSSHPNQSIQDFSPTFNDQNNTFATASGFNTPNNSTRGNFIPIEETYYIQGVSLGGNLPRSQKIRLEANELKGRLSPDSSAERSRFDRAPLDTNRVGLFYSMADQINKEIFNHIGDIELDDYVGDPNDEFESIYPNLESFANAYWKKYTDRNDVNAFIRIFSQFDFALFNQIKQLLPERVDEAMGLLVEPNALERNKSHITKQPSFTKPVYNALITDTNPTASGEYINYEASLSFADSIITMESIYHTASVGYTDSNYLFNIQVMQTASFTGSVNEGFILNSRASDIFSTETFFYSSFASQSLGQYFSRSNAAATYRDDNFQNIDNQRYAGSRITAPGINIDSEYPQLNFKPIIEVFAVNPNQLIFNETPPPDEQGTLRVQ